MHKIRFILFIILICSARNTFSYDTQGTLFVTGREYENQRISMDGNNIPVLGEYLGNTGFFQCFLNCISQIQNNSCSAVAIQKDKIRDTYECFAYKTSLCQENALKLEVSTGFQLYDRLQSESMQRVTCLAMISGQSNTGFAETEVTTSDFESITTIQSPATTVTSPDNYFHSSDGALYYMDGSVKSFKDAGSACDKKLLARAKIRNELAIDSIISNMAQFTLNEVYIGLEMLNTGTWQWKLDSTAVDPQIWAPGEPASETAVAAGYASNQVHLSDEFPNAPQKYICEAPSPATGQPCPASFQKTPNNRCLYYATTTANFATAAQNCVNLLSTAFLAGVYTPQQVSDFGSKLASSPNVKFYVGMTWNFTSLKWITNTGDAVSASLPFAVGEPSHSRNTAAVLGSDSTIRTIMNASQRGFVCEALSSCDALNLFKFPTGLYYIKSSVATDVKVICENTVDDGGWTIIYSRDYLHPDGSNFDRTKQEMENGFGSPDTENYYIGTKVLVAISQVTNLQLRVVITTSDINQYLAKYSTFNITMSHFYVSGYSGNAGDGLLTQNLQPLDTTKTICPSDAGQWWFASAEACDKQTNLNSAPLNSGAPFTARWVSKDASTYTVYNNITSVQMMTRPKMKLG